MTKAKKTPVFFIATKIKEKPAVINFYTTTGIRVKRESVQREKSSIGGTYYFANA